MSVDLPQGWSHRKCHKVQNFFCGTANILGHTLKTSAPKQIYFSECFIFIFFFNVHLLPNPLDPRKESQEGHWSGQTIPCVAEAEQWLRLRTIHPTPPPRMLHAAVSVGDRMYVVGGRGRESLRDVWCFEARMQLLCMCSRCCTSVFLCRAPGARGGGGDLFPTVLARANLGTKNRQFA